MVAILTDVVKLDNRYRDINLMSRHWHVVTASSSDVATSSSDVEIESEDRWLWFQPMSRHWVPMSRHWLNAQCRDIPRSMSRHS